MLYYCKTPQGNFGDELNLWLWPRLAPEVCDKNDPTLFVGIGTILSRRIPTEPFKIIFGAGWGGGRVPRTDARWRFYCVRGPRTAAGLNLDPSLALADPAILVRQVPIKAARKCYPVALMPHHQSMPKADWPALCRRAGMHCIDPRSPVEQVLTELQQTELLLAEAMHGAIVADALRVPWIAVRLYGRFTLFKWQDWTESLRLPLRIADVPPVFERKPTLRKRLDYTIKRGLARAGVGDDNWNRLETRASTEREVSQTLRCLERVSRHQPPCLSKERTLLERNSRLLEKLSEVRAAYQGGHFHPGDSFHR